MQDHLSKVRYMQSVNQMHMNLIVENEDICTYTLHLYWVLGQCIAQLFNFEGQ